jgi:uncharacterized metal-binding protein
MEETELLEEAERLLKLEENLSFFQAVARVEAEGYCKWPRVREIAEICKRMGFTRSDIMKEHGIETTAAMCKSGGLPKEGFGLTDKDKVRPGTFEVICNPIMQALYLNKQQTPLNVILGLCAGHDALFVKYAKAFSITLIAKDRVMAHNPAGALYVKNYTRGMLFD